MTRPNPMDKWVAYFRKHRFVIIGGTLLVIGYTLGKDLVLNSDARGPSGLDGQEIEANP